MSVISRFVCSSPRISLLQTNVQRSFNRHFQRKSNPPTIEKPVPKAEPVRPEDITEFASNERSSLAKYYLYTAAFVPTAFVGCMVWQYENFRNKSLRRGIRQHAGFSRQKEFSFRDHLNSMWNQRSPGSKMVIGLTAANLLVFLMWRVPALQGAMTKYFMCLPVKGFSVFGATLSGFSHVSPLHIGANMYVMWSFMDGCLHLMNHEQLLAVFLSGITISSVVSATYKVVSGRMIPSLGASGGILTIIAVLCYNMPDARISIAFVDQIIPHSFSAQNAIYGVIALDVLGLLLRWKLFDHAGHLGGVLFGIAYAAYGKPLIWDRYKQDVLKRWHRIRNPPVNS